MLISNNTKAVITMQDFEASIVVSKKDCLIIQHYNYICSHPRDSHGKPYGSTNCALLDIVINIDNFHTVHNFYEMLQKQEAYTFSLFFNAVYDEQQYIKSYDQVLKVDGYVVDVEESFDSETPEASNREQMFFKVRLLLSKIKFISDNNSVQQIISQ